MTQLTQTALLGVEPAMAQLAQTAKNITMIIINAITITKTMTKPIMIMDKALKAILEKLGV